MSNANDLIFTCQVACASNVWAKKKTLEKNDISITAGIIAYILEIQIVNGEWMIFNFGQWTQCNCKPQKVEYNVNGSFLM